MARQNRGLALTALGDQSHDEVRDSFEKALTLLMDPRAEEIVPAVRSHRRVLRPVWPDHRGLRVSGGGGVGLHGSRTVAPAPSRVAHAAEQRRRYESSRLAAHSSCRKAVLPSRV